MSKYGWPRKQKYFDRMRKAWYNNQSKLISKHLTFQYLVLYPYIYIPHPLIPIEDGLYSLKCGPLAQLGRAADF